MGNINICYPRRELISKFHGSNLKTSNSGLLVGNKHIHELYDGSLLTLCLICCVDRSCCSFI